MAGARSRSPICPILTVFQTKTALEGRVRPLAPDLLAIVASSTPAVVRDEESSRKRCRNSARPNDRCTR